MTQEIKGDERVLDGWVLVPEDLWTHRYDWHKACVIARKHSSSADDKAYWTHQLNTLDNVKQAMLTAPPHPPTPTWPGRWGSWWRRQGSIERQKVRSMERTSDLGATGQRETRLMPSSPSSPTRRSRDGREDDAA